MTIHDINKNIFVIYLGTTNYYKNFECNYYLLTSVNVDKIFFTVNVFDDIFDSDWVLLENYLKFEKKYKYEQRNKKINSL